jgi:hypothetical protein
MGPTLGGWLTDSYSWHWVFLINLPIGAITVIGLMVFMDDTKTGAIRRFDWFGFLSLAIGIGALQIMLDRGETAGWFSSSEIVTELIIAVAGFYFFFAHSFTTDNPFVRFAIFRDRNFVKGARSGQGEAEVRTPDPESGCINPPSLASHRHSNSVVPRARSTAAATIMRERVEALFIGADEYFASRRVQLLTLATRHGIATSYSDRNFPKAGGLMSYGTDLAEMYRQVGAYTGQILKGAKPADLPVVQSTRFEFVINMQTAALGIEVPPTMLARADYVIK